MKILTDTELRARWYKTHLAVFAVEKDTMVTPAARDFLKEHGITLVQKDDSEKDGPGPDGPAGYIIGATGRHTDQKPEDMTHLYGRVLVGKDHPRIAFRGKLDSLEAKILETQQIARGEDRPDLCAVLEEVLDFVKLILRSEVRAEVLREVRILGLEGSEIRQMSHNVEKYFGIPHPTPSYSMGKLCVALNSLRTAVRETELQAVHAAAGDGFQGGAQIVEALNRLSSFVYLIFCGELTGRRPYLREGQSRGGSSAGCTSGTGIPVEASGRHVHLTTEAIRVLFGKDQLTRKGDLSQPGQFVAQERVRISTPKGGFDNVAVLGPARREVQVELSLTDARSLGIKVPVNMSGCLKNAADVVLEGPCGTWRAAGSAIASRAHIHMSPEDARVHGVKDGESVAVRLATTRPVTIDDVVIRVSKDFSLAMHLDYDEANACQYEKGDMGYIVRKGNP